MIHIFEQDLLPNIKNYDVILFGMGLNHSFNQGFLYDLALNFPDIKQHENQGTGYGDRRKYGTIFSIVSHEKSVDGKIFCACYMNDGGYRRKKGNLDCVRYDSLEKSLIAARDRYKGRGFKMAAPIIGANYYDGYGDKEKILSIFMKVFTDVDIDIYDYVQKDFKLELFKESNKTYNDYKNGIIDKETYKKKMNELSWKKNHGIFKEMPKNYRYISKSNLIRVKKTDLE